MLVRVLIYLAWLALPHGPQQSEADPECIFSLLTHTKELVLVTFCLILTDLREKLGGRSSKSSSGRFQTPPLPPLSTKMDLLR